MADIEAHKAEKAGLSGPEIAKLAVFLNLPPDAAPDAVARRYREEAERLKNDKSWRENGADVADTLPNNFDAARVEAWAAEMEQN